VRSSGAERLVGSADPWLVNALKGDIAILFFGWKNLMHRSRNDARVKRFFA
jgi:hypothetical protein